MTISVFGFEYFAHKCGFQLHQHVSSVVQICRGTFMKLFTTVRATVSFLALLTGFHCAAFGADNLLEQELRAMNDAVLQTMPTGTRVLAVCGPSEGRGYYLSPDHSGWEDDPISKGRVIIVAGPDGEPNVLFADARGDFVDATADGGSVTFSFMNDEKKSFGLIETYPKTGVTQTYVFSTSPSGERVLLWTAAKAHISTVGITKVAAFASKCL